MLGLALLSGALAATVAIFLKKNPVSWFIGGALVVFVAPGVIIAALFVALILRLKRKKAPKTNNKAQEDVVTLNVSPEQTLSSAKEHIQKIWYFLDEKRNTIGPISFSMLQQKWREGQVLKETLLWNESLGAWKPLRELFPNA